MKNDRMFLWIQLVTILLPFKFVFRPMTLN